MKESKAWKFCHDFLEWLCIIILVALTITVLIMVLGRVVFARMPVWGEEFSILCLTWLSLLCAGVGEFDGAHIRVDVLNSLLPKKIYRWFELAFSIIKLVLMAVLIYYGIQQVKMTINSTMVSMPFSQAWRFLSGIVFCVSVFVAVLIRMKGGKKHD